MSGDPAAASAAGARRHPPLRGAGRRGARGGRGRSRSKVPGSTGSPWSPGTARNEPGGSRHAGAAAFGALSAALSAAREKACGAARARFLGHLLSIVARPPFEPSPSGPLPVPLARGARGGAAADATDTPSRGLAGTRTFSRRGARTAAVEATRGRPRAAQPGPRAQARQTDGRRRSADPGRRRPSCEPNSRGFPGAAGRERPRAGERGGVG